MITKQELIKYFQDGCKTNDNLKIGVEHEKFIFYKNSNKRINFNTVMEVLKFLEKFDWIAVKEKNNVIGLKKGKKNITLEPGNQVELSGAPLKSIHQNCSESYEFLNELKKACKYFDLKMVSTSFDPFSKLETIPKTPKQRYEIMNEEMPKNGNLSLEMMYQTCGTQINLDYVSEVDFINKFKLSSFLVPLSIAIFSNSPIKEKKLNGYLSYRSKIWQNTSRGGLPQSFLEDMNFEKYAEFVISMPLLFIFNNKEHLPPKNYIFKDFMEGKIKELNNNLPNNKDLEIHLSTIFTEVRLKNYLEIRSLDACEWDCHCAGPAFFTGILYGNLDESLELIKKWNIDEVLNAYVEAPKKGLNVEINGKSIFEWSKIFLNISKEGLISRNNINLKKNDETVYLKNIENILRTKKTKAQETLDNLK